MTFRPRLLFVALALLLTAPAAFAQPSDIAKDTPRLSWRFDLLLKAKNPQTKTDIENGIATERTAIRGELEQGLAKTLQAGGGIPAAEELVLVLDQQRSLVSFINQRIDATRADLALLQKEETFYGERQRTGTGSPPPGLVLQTKSYAELLARKAVLEEQLAALQAIHATQQERLNELQSEQQVRNVGILWTIFLYLGIFFIVFSLERFIRLSLLSRIRHRRLRYTISKTFTAAVYAILAFWFIQKIYAEHPGITTVLAVVAAALVIVFQDLLKGIVGWFGMRNVLGLGQRVSIGELTGDVLDIGFIHTTLLISRTSSMEDVGQVGKLVRVPNERLLSRHVVNYHSTSDFENVEFPVVLARSDQSETARGILEDIVKKETEGFAERAQRQTDQRMRGFFATHPPLAWRVYLDLTEDGAARFTICFPAPIGQRRAVTTLLVREMLKKFAEAGIRLAADVQTR